MLQSLQNVIFKWGPLYISGETYVDPISDELAANLKNAKFNIYKVGVQTWGAG